MKPSTSKSFYTLSEENAMLIACVTERISVAEFRSLLIEMTERASKKNISKLLLNGSSIDFSNIMLSERHDIGLAAVEILKGDFKAVLLIQQEYINKHGENVANNRGADVLVTHSMEEAYEWLLK